MTLKLVRVDDRLIHGQVIAVWLRALGAEVIVVVDDATAEDAFLKEVIELAAPEGVEVEVHGVEDAIAPVKELAASDIDTFVLMKTPQVALRLVEGGAPLTVLNVGGMGAAADRSSLYRNISASPAELDAMRELESRGVKVELRIVADEAGVAFSSVDKKAGVTP